MLNWLKKRLVLYIGNVLVRLNDWLCGRKLIENSIKLDKKYDYGSYILIVYKVHYNSQLYMFSRFYDKNGMSDKNDHSDHNEYNEYNEHNWTFDVDVLVSKRKSILSVVSNDGTDYTDIFRQFIHHYDPDSETYDHIEKIKGHIDHKDNFLCMVTSELKMVEI